MDILKGFFTEVNKKTLNQESNFSRSRRERREEGLMRENARLQRDATVEAAKIIRKQEREEAESAARLARWERERPAREAAAREKEDARVNREFFEEQALRAYFRREEFAKRQQQK